MPRYFFHVEDGADITDDVGMELAGVAEAKCEAMRYAGRLICDGAGGFWDAGDWSMTVSDETGLTLFTLHLSGIEAPAIQASARSR
jgi:hypothetical protein